jgi:hypothetical protein
MAPLVLALLVLAPASEPVEYTSNLHALALSAEVSTGIFGHAILGGVGLQSRGARTFVDRRWLVAWTGRGELVSGFAAYTLPFRALLGGRLEGGADAGYRVLHASDWSPVVAVGLDTRLSSIAQLAPTKINNQDGLGGIITGADLRMGGGASFIRGRHALLLTLNLLGRANAPQSNAPALAYGGGALHVRYDLSDALAALGDVSLVVTPKLPNRALGFIAQIDTWTISGSVVKRFGAHAYFGIGAVLSRSESTTAYTAAQTYTTAAPITAQFWITGGYAR